MNHLQHDLVLRVVKGINALAMTAPFAVCWMLYYAAQIVAPFYQRGNWVMILVALILYVVLGRVYDAFLVSLNRISEMVYSQALSALIADGLLYLIIVLLARRLINPLPLLLALAGQILIAVVWAFLAHQWYFWTFPPKRTFIIYDMRIGMEQLIREYGLSKKFQILDSIRADICIAERLSDLQSVEAVFLCGVHSRDRNIILKQCIEHRVTVYVIPRIGDTIMSSAKQMHMFHLPLLRVDRYNPSPEYLFIKRTADIVISVLALVILSPVFLGTAIAIKAEDGKDVFYRQTRMTKDGKMFKIIKFRSMRMDAEKDGVARLSTGDADDRITRTGRAIRKVRIDELPQLINILKGDLSIVGPRPERPEIAAEYEMEMPEFSLRLQAKAGLTGLAQVYGKYNTTPYDKLQMDLMYIAHPSIWEDLRIMFATVKILFIAESTEGVSEQNPAAPVQEAAAEEKEYELISK